MESVKKRLASIKTANGFTGGQIRGKKILLFLSLPRNAIGFKDAENFTFQGRNAIELSELEPDIGIEYLGPPSLKAVH